MGAATREEAEAHKARGNELLKAGKAAEAAEAYGLAIEADPEVAAFWSNRSMARLKAGDATGALADAEEAVRLKPGWTKGHHRKATALQALGRPREGAAACAGGLAAAAEGTEEGELKELRRLKKVLITSAGELTIRGWWHGKVSETLGGYEQEFHFKPEGVLECVVYGSELVGSYRVADVEEAQGGGFRGGVDVTLNESTKVPYLFRVDDGDGLLHLCCPMVSANERPRTFDGPGYVAMRPGRVSGKEEAALAELPEGRRIVMYLDELATIMESRPSTSTGAGADAAEKLEESGEGSTLTQSQVFGQESVEERAKKMAADQKMAALRIKYTGEIEDIAQKLISGEVDETKAYPDEARDLERMLRRFGGRRKAKEGRQAAAAPAAPAPALADSAVQAPKPAAPAAAPAAAIAPAPSAAPAPAPPAAEKPAAVAASAPRPPAGSCWQACFSGLSRRKQ